MTDSDRELLELAARAAGLKIEGEADKLCVFPAHRTGGLSVFNDRGGSQLWNPRTDDGDALRLMTRLHLYVKHFPFLEDDTDKYPGFVEVWRTDDSDPLWVEYLTAESERLEVTRRAITRAAAEIGKAM